MASVFDRYPATPQTNILFCCQDVISDYFSALIELEFNESEREDVHGKRSRKRNRGGIYRAKS